MQIARQIRNESFTVDYAGFWIRLLAVIIDGLILGVVIWVFNGLWPFAFGLGWMGGTEGAVISYGEVGGAFWILGILIPFVLMVAYHICFWALPNSAIVCPSTRNLLQYRPPELPMPQMLIPQARSSRVDITLRPAISFIT